MMSNIDVYVFHDKLHSLLRDKETDWKYVVGDLYRLVENMEWNEKKNEWEHSMFNVWDIIAQVLLADEEALEPFKKYIDKVSELGIQTWTTEMKA